MRRRGVFQQDAVLWTGNGLYVASRGLPPPRGSEVIVQLDAIGLCSSDFHIWCGRKPGRPGVLGHEGAGTVLAVGENVRRTAPGDFVIVNPLLNCGRCELCDRALGHVCPDREIVGYNGRGLTATAQTLDERSLLTPPPGFPRQHGWLVEPLACVIHAQRRLGSEPEENILVLGCGPMGVMHATYARLRGVQRVWLCDRDEAKLALARSRGVEADEWIPLPDLPRRIEALTDGRGADVTVTANSMRDGHEPAFQLTRSGGRVLAFASILDRPGPIALPNGSVDSDDVHRREDRVSVAAPRGPVTVIGCIGFDADSFLEAARTVPRIDGERFITAVRRLEDVPALVRGEWARHLKIVIYPSNGTQHAVREC
jgi:threonine dehydrogenase-like Zn-dependent dehydrogenase